MFISCLSVEICKYIKSCSLGNTLSFVFVKICKYIKSYSLGNTLSFVFVKTCKYIKSYGLGIPKKMIKINICCVNISGTLGVSSDEETDLMLWLRQAGSECGSLRGRDLPGQLPRQSVPAQRPGGRCHDAGSQPGRQPGSLSHRTDSVSLHPCKL